MASNQCPAARVRLEDPNGKHDDIMLEGDACIAISVKDGVFKASAIGDVSKIAAPLLPLIAKAMMSKFGGG